MRPHPAAQPFTWKYPPRPPPPPPPPPPGVIFSFLWEISATIPVAAFGWGAKVRRRQARSLEPTMPTGEEVGGKWRKRAM